MFVNSILLKYFIKLDYRDKEKNTLRKFFGIFISYIISNTFLSLYYYMNFDAMSFAVMCYTFNTFLIAFLSMGEYPQLFFAKEQYELIITLPLDRNTFLKSKYLSALLYILSFSLVLSVPQSVFFFFFDGNPVHSVLFLIMNLAFTFSFASVLLIIYTLALKIFSEKGTLFLFVVQIIFFGTIMYSTSIGSRAVQYHSDTIMNVKFINYSPMKFYASGIYEYQYATAGIILTFILLFSLLKLISYFFEDIYGVLYSIKPKDRKLRKLKIFDSYTDFIEKIFVRDSIEKSGYKLARNIITGSKSMVLRYLPLASAPFIIGLIGIISGNESLTFIKKDLNPGAIPVLSPSITMIIIMMSRMFVSNLQIADENSNDVMWIYESLPLESPARIFRGSYKFIYYSFIILPVLLITLLLSIKFSVEIVILNIIYILSFSTFAMTISHLFIKNYPFTLESSKINSASKLLDVLISAIFAIGIFILQFILFENYTYIFISIITILALNFLITKQIRNYGTGKKHFSNREQTA